MKAGVSKNPTEILDPTCSVTPRYIRLKQATPSSAGSAAAIARICSTAWSMVDTGSAGQAMLMGRV